MEDSFPGFRVVNDLPKYKKIEAKRQNGEGVNKEDIMLSVNGKPAGDCLHYFINQKKVGKYPKVRVWIGLKINGQAGQ